MRIVLLTSKLHPAAEFAVNKLYRSKGDLDIVGLVVSDISPFKRTYWNYALYGLKRSGIFYGLLTALICYFHLIGIFIAGILFWWRKRQWLSLEELAYYYQAELIYTDDINSDDTLEKLRELEPDIVISLYFNQILKTEAIKVASMATLNMHPGILPGYRGVWPTFWKLYKGDTEAGITIHYINEEIDAGDLLDIHTYPIEEDDTKFSLWLKSGHHGAKRLLSLLKQFKQGIKPHPIKSSGKPRYRSLPKRKHFEKFHEKGKKLLYFFRDLFSVIKLSRDLEDHNYSSSKSNSFTSKSSSSKSEDS